MKLKLITATGFLVVTAITITFVSCQSPEKIEFERYYTAGALIYQASCQNCHGKNGEGLNGLIPPLTDSIYLKNNKSGLACFVKNGLKQKITINNKTFEDPMPANDLAPIDIARVLTYVTNSFGNQLGTTNLQQASVDMGNCK